MHNKKIYDIHIAIERIKNYCALQDRCQHDAIKKMEEWQLSQIAQEHILEILINEKYVDEERYSISFCRGKFKINRWGKNKIKNHLKKKNISEICIKKGLKKIDDNEYLELIDTLIQKKKNTLKEKNTFILKNKIAKYMIQKGFESNLIWNIIR